MPTPHLSELHDTLLQDKFLPLAARHLAWLRRFASQLTCSAPFATCSSLIPKAADSQVEDNYNKEVARPAEPSISTAEGNCAMKEAAENDTQGGAMKRIRYDKSGVLDVTEPLER